MRVQMKPVGRQRRIWTEKKQFSGQVEGNRGECGGKCTVHKLFGKSLKERSMIAISRFR